METTDEGEAQVSQSADLTTMYFMLFRLSQADPSDPNATSALSKLCLAVGGSFSGEDTVPVNAQHLITLLNKICSVYYQGDSETVFILTSLIVHLSSFPHGIDGLQTDASFQTRGQLLQYFMTQEKSEVVQSILRNECVMLNTACSTNEHIPFLYKHGIFKYFEQILSLHQELNSEITETVALLLARIATAPVGAIQIKTANIPAALDETLNYFAETNTLDERRDSIINTIRQIQDVLH